MNKQLKTLKISVQIQKVFLECVKFFDVFIQKKDTNKAFIYLQIASIALPSAVASKISTRGKI